jgi:hypothetical protein
MTEKHRTLAYRDRTTTVSGHDDTVSRANDNNRGGPRTLRNESGREAKEIKPKFYTRDLPFNGSIVQNPSIPGMWMFHTGNDDVDVSEDGVRWYHLLGPACLNHHSVLEIVLP